MIATYQRETHNLNKMDDNKIVTVRNVATTRILTRVINYLSRKSKGEGITKLSQDCCVVKRESLKGALQFLLSNNMILVKRIDGDKRYLINPEFKKLKKKVRK